MRAIQISRYGGPEVLEPVELPDPVPGPDQVLVDVEAAGVNYADTHLADGSYLSSPKLPFVPGSEVIGRTADGRRVMGLSTGGGYAEKALLPAALTVEVPEAIGDGEALALLVQGLSAWHLLRTSARLTPGESVVVNAAAGGVGSLAVQLAKAFGAGRVIATASTPDKQRLALDLGADVAVSGDADGYAERVIEANGGKRVDVVLDAVSGPVFDAAFEALGQFGRLVTFGAASRQVAKPVEPGRLMMRNLSVVGFWLSPALAVPGMFAPPLTELFELVTAGRVRPVVGGEYPLAETRRAHEDLLARRTTGKLILRA
ncbi:quinone oxidoreductase family protein [Planosporangium mesophilum]|uniref:NADPH:quinone reductase n=1 Tax=Planosporangium mesophilum TaxID=689768 RepID=A0A8J3TGX0_9ACTN|nr:NADPH:quinone oxidoreductase family protein [Planosporangium mesophilum]NJC81097.1 NADPH:quinone oxidoreductase family protein [Planosporangium mesophilum]GII21255.1 NADPH:quinone reductase [Planosporangium mesophilum]